MREVEQGEREGSWFEGGFCFLFLVSGGIIGFARAQMPSMWSSGREWLRRSWSDFGGERPSTGFL